MNRPEERERCGDQSVAALAREFDEAFSRMVDVEPGATQEFLAVRVGEHGVALRAHEVASILRCPRIVPLPTSDPALAGIVGVRGAIVAVYTMATLLGLDGRSGGGWIAVCQADHSVAMCFDDLIGYKRIAGGDVHTLEAADRAQPSHTSGVARFGDSVLPVIDISRVIDAIDARRGTPSTETK